MQIATVIEGSPAQAAGLRPGDVLVELDGEPIGDAGALQRLMVGESIGRSIVARIIRDGRERLRTVVLDELPA